MDDWAQRKARARAAQERYQERLRTDPDLAARRAESVRRSEQKRLGNRGQERAEHDNRTRPGRKDSRTNRKRPPRGAPWVVSTIDGEGFEFDDGQRYSLLHVYGRREPLTAEGGLGTHEILEYILSLPSSFALLGFGLNYDVEHWLRDLSDAEYLALTNGGQEIVWHGFRLRWIPGKMLVIQRGGYRREVLDTLGWYQTSLVSALRSYGLPVPEEVSAGKGARGGFAWADLPEVRRYAEAEGIVARHLHLALHAAVNGGLAALGMAPLQKRELYGPGALAKRLLRETNWREENPLCPLPALPDLPEGFPFLAAYYGGRIEAAAIGEWQEVEDWDLHSAYPAALSRLPSWAPGDYAYAEGDEARAAWAARPIGMALLEWQFPEGWDWYPFPYRTHAGNLHFPSCGRAWVMSPEYWAAPQDSVRVLAAVWLRRTEGLGDGQTPGPARGTLPAMITRAYETRARLEAEGNAGERGVKLMLNSISGKLIQQVGRSPEKPGDFSDLSSAWYTSWTRAQVWRTIYAADAHVGHRVLSVQTDGVVALPGVLQPEEGAGLGQWERETWHGYRQFGAGLYTAAGGLRRMRRRGFPAFDAEQAWRVVRGEQDMLAARYRLFVGRRHALAEPSLRCWTPGHEGAPDTTLGESRYQWRETVRVYVPSLGSKRTEPWVSARSRKRPEEQAARAAAWRRRHWPADDALWTTPKPNLAWAAGIVSAPYTPRWRRSDAWVAPAETPQEGDALSPAEEARIETYEDTP